MAVWQIGGYTLIAGWSKHLPADTISCLSYLLHTLSHIQIPCTCQLTVQRRGLSPGCSPSLYSHWPRMTTQTKQTTICCCFFFLPRTHGEAVSLTCHNSIYCRTCSCCCWLPPCLHWCSAQGMATTQINKCKIIIKKINKQQTDDGGCFFSLLLLLSPPLRQTQTRTKGIAVKCVSTPAAVAAALWTVPPPGAGEGEANLCQAAN